MKKITLISRVVIALSSLAMLGSYYFPLWRIELWAPQYPEGLALSIWHNKLGGDVDIINGLNHYIGMAHLKQESFPEFIILPYLIAFFVGLGLVVAAIGQRRFLLDYVVLMVLAGIAALADFYRWGYQYGHNLDPNAAIKVPGMSYQPPVLGYKSLLNFGAFSIPDLGGWIFIGAGVLIAFLLVYEYFFCPDCIKARKAKALKFKHLASVSSLMIVLFFSSCSTQNEPIHYGSDGCHFCKMTIVDKKFGCELVTTKGKIFKFDDVHCLVKWMNQNQTTDKDYAFMLVNGFNTEGVLIDVKTAFFQKSETFKSPMRGDIAAFKTEEEARKAQPADAKTMNWSTVVSEFSN